MPFSPGVVAVLFISLFSSAAHATECRQPELSHLIGYLEGRARSAEALMRVQTETLSNLQKGQAALSRHDLATRALRHLGTSSGRAPVVSSLQAILSGGGVGHRKFSTTAMNAPASTTGVAGLSDALPELFVGIDRAQTDASAEIDEALTQMSGRWWTFSWPADWDDGRYSKALEKEAQTHLELYALDAEVASRVASELREICVRKKPLSFRVDWIQSHQSE